MDLPALPPSLCFGPFTLLAGQRRLLRAGEEVALGPRAFDLLCELLRQPGELVDRATLMQRVWRELVVEEANLHVQVSQLRKVIGADALATVPAQGYRFAWPVRAAAAPPAMATLAAQAAPASRRLSVIVLPFIEPGAADEQRYFADALTDDITTQLSKIRGSFVIGAPTAFSYGRGVADFSAVAAELGVRYVLQGRVLRDEHEIEVNARLSDACTGAVIWSDALVLPRGGVLAMRRELVARLAAALNLQLVHAEASRSAPWVGSSTPSTSGAAAGAAASGAVLEAADLVMQARQACGWNWTLADYLRARQLYDAALTLDPHNAEALARRASLLANLANAWPGPEVEAQVAQAEADAGQALQLDSLLPMAHQALSHVRQQQYRLDEAAAAADQALELDPNAVMALQWRAELHRYAGQSARGLPLLQRALVLSPRDPARWIFHARMGWLLVHLARHEDAQPWFERSLALQPHWTTRMGLAVVLAQQGQLAEARAQLPPLATPEALQHRRWQRVSRHPDFLRESREQVFAPLLRCGALPGPEAVQAWEARQLRGGQPLAQQATDAGATDGGAAARRALPVHAPLEAFRQG